MRVLNLVSVASVGVVLAMTGHMAVAQAETATPSEGAVQSGDAKIVAVVDRARLVKVPAGAQTLIIGNPTIADVTLLRKNGMMILTPKAFGETNFIALDASGNPVAESTIQVVAGTDSLIVQRGAERQSYSCAPRCQPTERLGDDEKYLTGVASQASSHNARLAGSAPPTAPGLITAR